MCAHEFEAFSPTFIMRFGFISHRNDFLLLIRVLNNFWNPLMLEQQTAILWLQFFIYRVLRLLEGCQGNIYAGFVVKWKNI